MKELKAILNRELRKATEWRDLYEKEGNVEKYNYYDGKAWGLAMAIVEISYNDKLKTKKP